MPHFRVLLFCRLFIIIILVDLNSEILLGKRGSTCMLTLFKLFKDNERPLVTTARSGRGNRTGVKFEKVGVDRIGGAVEFR